MADYTYAQLSQMQQEAAQRVREMRKRAKQFVQDDVVQAGETEVTQAGNNHSYSAEPQTMARTPHSISLPNGLQGAKAALSTDARKLNNENMSILKDCHDEEQQSDFFASAVSNQEDTTAMADRALLLSLCFLLQAENVDESLILALLYLMA